MSIDTDNVKRMKELHRLIDTHMLELGELTQTISQEEWEELPEIVQATGNLAIVFKATKEAGK